MEPHMVDAVLLASLEIVVPLVISHSHMSRQRPYAGVVLTSQECLASIHGEMVAFCLEVAKGKGGGHLVRLALTFHPYFHLVEVLRSVLAPFFAFSPRS